MYLEQLPQEDGETRILYPVRDRGHLIDQGLSADLIGNYLGYEGWLRAFHEHCGDRLGLPGEYESHRHQFGLSVKIPLPDTRIEFVVDLDHSALKGYMDHRDEEARQIFFEFIDRLRK